MINYPHLPRNPKTTQLMPSRSIQTHEIKMFPQPLSILTIPYDSTILTAQPPSNTPVNSATKPPVHTGQCAQGIRLTEIAEKAMNGALVFKYTFHCGCCKKTTTVGELCIEHRFPNVRCILCEAKSLHGFVEEKRCRLDRGKWCL